MHLQHHNVLGVVFVVYVPQTQRILSLYIFKTPGRQEPLLINYLDILFVLKAKMRYSTFQTNYRLGVPGLIIIHKYAEYKR